MSSCTEKGMSHMRLSLIASLLCRTLREKERLSRIFKELNSMIISRLNVTDMRDNTVRECELGT